MPMNNSPDDGLPVPGAADEPGLSLRLRPWRGQDAAVLAALHRDAALRRWAGAGIDDEESAARWIEEQRRHRQAGDRFAFAVVEAGPAGERIMGHVVVQNLASDSPSAQVGYWTTAAARGRGVAPRALAALTDWAFATFAARGLTRLELVHQADNTASCRVAAKCAYEPAGILPAAPPEYPLDGHLHVRTRVTSAGPLSA